MRLISGTAAALVTAVGKSILHEGGANAGCTAIRHLCETPENRQLLQAAGASALLLSALQAHVVHRGSVAAACQALQALYADAEGAAVADTDHLAQAQHAAITQHAGDVVVESGVLDAVKEVVAACRPAVRPFLDSGLAAAAIAMLCRQGASLLVVRSALAALVLLSVHAASADLDRLLAAGAAAAVNTVLDSTADHASAHDGCLILEICWRAQLAASFCVTASR